jgi:ABC-type tungstate transport system substrate-binding protein
VEEEEEQRYVDSFRREAVGVAGAVALELKQVVAELVHAVGIGGEVEACEDGVVDLL